MKIGREGGRETETGRHTDRQAARQAARNRQPGTQTAVSGRDDIRGTTVRKSNLIQILDQMRKIGVSHLELHEERVEELRVASEEDLPARSALVDDLQPRLSSLQSEVSLSLTDSGPRWSARLLCVRVTRP